jgi:LysM repeat protein
MEVNRIRFLTQALFVSGAINIFLLAVVFYWFVRDVPPAETFELKPLSQEKQEGSVAVDYSNAEVIRKYRSLSLEQLLAKLSETNVVQNGYSYRDLALASLVTFHHFDLQRAIQGLTHPSQQRLIPYGKTKEGNVLEVVAFPSLSDQYFQAIIRFASTEKWPITSQGLFLLIKKQGDKYDLSLADAFFLTPEFFSIETLFKRTEKSIARTTLLAMLAQGDWQQLSAFVEQQRIAQDLSPERRQKLLLDYASHGSVVAAQLMLHTEPAFAINKLDDSQVLSVLKLLNEKSLESERYALILLTSPRSDEVWQMAANRLFEYAGEAKPEKNIHHHALVRFMPKALQKLAPSIAAVPESKTSKPMNPQQKTKKIVATLNAQKAVKPNEKTATLVSSAKQAVSPTPAKQVATVKKATPVVAKKLHTYVIVEGDSLWKISKRFKVDVAALKKQNNLKSDALKPGTILTIP